jgi:hypothetical protein
MRIARGLVCVAASLILLAPLAAAPLWSEDFAAGLGAWTVAGDPAAAQVAPDAGKNGPGLRLTGPGAATSPELPAAADGLVLSFQARHLSGAGALTLALVRSDADLHAAPPPAWRCDVRPDGRWHRLDLTLIPPPGDKWRLVLAVEPGGAWTLGDLSLVPAPTAAPPADPWLTGLNKAHAPDPLPAGWAPQGTLDATPRAIGEGTELLVNLVGMVLSLPTDLDVPRGTRQPLLIYADNRGQVDKDLTVAVQCTSPGAYMPTYTVPIHHGGTTAVLAPVQVLRSGDCWAKFTFTTNKESASAAVRLHVTDAYPALGQFGRFIASSIAPHNLPFSSFTFSSPQDPPVPGDSLRLPLPATDPVTALSPDLLKYRPALAQLAPGAGDPATAATQTVAAYQALTQQVLPNLPHTALVSPSWLVTPSEQGLQPSPVLQAAFAGGLAKWVASVAVGVGELPAAAVVGERVDGHPRPLANSFWQLFAQRYDFTALRTTLAQPGPARPLLLDLSALPPGASPRLELMLLARLLLEQTWQGSTGVLLAADGHPLADASVTEGIQELWRELAGAVPILVTTENDGLCGSGLDAPVHCWGFVRGAEGMLFLANNTSDQVDVTAEIRAEPTRMQVLRLRPTGRAVTREIQDVFRFPDEAQSRRQQAVYVRLAPGEIVGLSVELTGEDWSWLRSVGRMIPREQEHPLSGPPPAEGDKPWYERNRPMF